MFSQKELQSRSMADYRNVAKAERAQLPRLTQYLMVTLQDCLFSGMINSFILILSV
jgi:hypothetical protein